MKTPCRLLLLMGPFVLGACCSSSRGVPRPLEQQPDCSGAFSVNSATTAQFAAGVEQQLKASDLSDGAERRQTLAHARRAYDTVLAVRPHDAAALNNRAMLEAAAGEINARRGLREWSGSIVLSSPLRRCTQAGE